LTHVNAMPQPDTQITGRRQMVGGGAGTAAAVEVVSAAAEGWT
jgi:hypothetical protein